MGSFPEDMGRVMMGVVVGVEVWRHEWNTEWGVVGEGVERIGI